MGSLTLPAAGVLYVDTVPVSYTVERHADYEPLLLPLWAAIDAGTIEVVTSELTLLEVLVKPLRDHDLPLVQDYEKLLTATRLKTLPVTASILREAARIRAATNLRQALPAAYRLAQCYPDCGEAEAQVRSAGQHPVVGKASGQPAHGARWNLTLRQRLARFVRRTLSFSKAEKRHEAGLRRCLQRYNYTRAHTLG